MSYKRILLKISGESLMGEQKFGINSEACNQVAEKIKRLHDSGTQVAVVNGGGNIFRGLTAVSEGKLKITRSAADQVGMLATIINSITLQEALENIGIDSVVMTPKTCMDFSEVYRYKTASKYLDDSKVVIFSGGTSHPYFSTDSAAALRACEMQVDALVKATKVNGVFDKDPIKDPTAKKYTQISFSEALKNNLKIMDASAIALCRDNNIPIFVCHMDELNEACQDPSLGTIVNGD
jgi:uridylate kinase